jgi:hypothetical protein
MYGVIYKGSTVATYMRDIAPQVTTYILHFDQIKGSAGSTYKLTITNA